MARYIPFNKYRELDSIRIKIVSNYLNKLKKTPSIIQTHFFPSPSIQYPFFVKRTMKMICVQNYIVCKIIND